MTTFWSVFIIVITLGSIAGCGLLLFSCTKNKTGIEEGKSMGHSFDGIEELNNPLPQWWTYMFVATIIFALVYLAVYPGLGSYAGLFKWKSSEQGILSLAEGQQAIKQTAEDGGFTAYDLEMDKAQATFDKVFHKLIYNESGEYKAITDIAKDKQALTAGKNLFLQNCSQCHGSTARGAKGYPDLSDKDWLYGGSPEKIKETIMVGRNGLMPAGGGMPRTDEEVSALAAYVLSLSGRKVDATQAKQGKDLFAVCGACHMPDGSGMHALGAPNLTDKIWLYGGSRKAVEHTIKYGQNGVMPAWKDVLGEDKVQLISAYVYSLSNKQ